jgi:protein-export membrane protein SecD
MSKKRVWLITISILALAFFAGNLSYPDYFNRGVDFLNSKFNLKLPHFWQKPFRLGLDLQGGVHLLYQADLSNIKPEDRANSLQGLRDVIERRVNYFGVQEPIVQIQGDRLIVELAGIKDPAQAIQEIGKTPFLEFKEQRPEEEIKKIQEKQKELEGKTLEEAQKIPDWQLALKDPFLATSLTGKYLKKAELAFDQTTGKPLISLQFDDEGAKIFEELTARNVGKPLAIYIDNILISAPIVQDIIAGGKAQITGNFTIEEARELARNLSAGALPVPIELISQQTVGPILGKISLEQSLKAGILGFLSVILFMILFYRLPGVLASLALTIYIVLVLAVFKLVPVTLTLAGIAGFLLSIGMAVDANILIFSRMREELSEKKSFLVAVEEGFRRAWPSIRDSNLNSLIVCAILFTFATSFIKGFALTLAIGILFSLFSAIFITRMLLRLFINTKLEKIKWPW